MLVAIKEHHVSNKAIFFTANVSKYSLLTLISPSGGVMAAIMSATPILDPGKHFSQ